MSSQRLIQSAVALRLPAHSKLVDPTGLKPAPHGLKGRRSVTRAPGQEYLRFSIADCRLASSVRRINRRETSIGNRKSAIGNDLAVAEGFEPSHGRINSAVPYQLGYSTKRRDEVESMQEETIERSSSFILPNWRR